MRRGNRGVTLVEVMIASVILGILTLMIYGLIYRGSTTYAVASRHNTLQRNARNALDRIAEELRIANPDTLVAGMDGGGVGTLQFQTSTGFSGGATTWGPMIRYTYEASSVDANNNSIQDEGRLVREDLGSGVKATICDYVKKGGFVLSQTGQRVTITLTLVVADEKNKEMSSTVSTSIVLRNKSSS